MSSLEAFVGTNARYSVLGWEPVYGSGERINVAALFEYDGRIFARSLIRPDVLRCMYGAAGEGVLRMLDGVLEALSTVANAHGWDAALAAVPMTNFLLSPSRLTWASSEADLSRQVVLMNCSLSVIAEEPAATSDDLPTPEKEVSQQWTTRVKEAVQMLRPELSMYFNREAVLVDGGVPVRFAMLTPRLAAQFGLLRPAQQNQGMEDGRAKMWKLALAKERNSALAAMLVFGTPSQDDITLSDNQRDRLRSNVIELQQEAEHRLIELREVHTVADAARAVVEIA
ncbi:hypothetical protein ACXIVK_32205 [Paraburkholderia caledonica]